MLKLTKIKNAKLSYHERKLFDQKMNNYIYTKYIMKIKQKGFAIFTIMLIAVLGVSCTDQWENHYDAKSSGKIDMSLYEYLKSQENLSVFTKMVNVVGYDTILSKPQSFTVWAPDNSALEEFLPLLAQIELGLISTEDNLKAVSEIRKLVENHITRFLQTSSGLKTRKILMINGKIIEFSKSGTLISLGGKPISKSDIALNNGIVHILGEYYPYRQNLWEFINQTTGLDSLRNYINSLTRLEFDPSASIIDGVLMDSVMFETNDLLSELAALNFEDSVYTAILPDNEAWSEAFGRIFPFYKSAATDGGVDKQITRTKWALVQDLFFRNEINTPITADTLVATLGTAFATPARLFDNAQPKIMSNGISYVTSKLNYTATESWFKPIRIEAEYNFLGRLTLNYDAITLSGLGTGYDISSRNYVHFIDNSISTVSTLYITFPIPNTLSGKYNIYCVFVPTIIVDTTDLRPYKVKFSLQYMNAAGTVVNFGSVSTDNKVGTPTSAKGTFETNPNAIDKMLVVKDFEFPYSNIIDFSKQDFTKQINVALKVENATPKKTADMINFNRNIRIDCIILEPVQ